MIATFDAKSPTFYAASFVFPKSEEFAGYWLGLGVLGVFGVGRRQRAWRTLTMARVPLTDEDWHPLAEGEVMVLAKGTMVESCRPGN